MKWYGIQWNGTNSVWFSPPDEKDVSGVVCDTALDKTYEKIIEMIELWGKTYDRPMTIDELMAMWMAEPVVSNIKPRDYTNGWLYNSVIVSEFRKFKPFISDIYRKELYRDPTHDEMNYTFLGSMHEKREYQNNSPKKEMIALYDQKMFIDNCVVCGEPVYASCPHFLDGAGNITINFGYGSVRDCDYGKGYIHDFCSAKLDQQLLKYRFKWSNCLNGNRHDRYDLEKSKEVGRLVMSEQKKMKDYKGLDDFLEQYSDELSIDPDRNDNENT